jgi:D-alanyl-D-alanine carboxypeptidase/D-alanyl-D-alanine carboxypeptidase (penicillin-binding protein 5/6)
MENEIFAEIVSTVKKSVPLHDGEISRLLVNHNRLLREYGDIIGVKTGYTKKCGRTLVSAAQRDGVRLICVTLEDGNDWLDHRSLLDYGFSLYREITLSEKISYEIPVCGGEKSCVTVGTRGVLTAFLPENHGEIRVVTEMPRFLYAGVREGDIVGRVVFYADGAEVGEAYLYAEHSVQITRKEKNFWKILISFLNGRKRES